MTYTNIPLIIPILATGYLLTVYLLLGLAQRNLKEESQPDTAKVLQKKEILVTSKVREVSSVR